ncbi:hypothetical protein COSO111634_05295 [Corallococcus soli]
MHRRWSAATSTFDTGDTAPEESEPRATVWPMSSSVPARSSNVTPSGAWRTSTATTAGSVPTTTGRSHDSVWTRATAPPVIRLAAPTASSSIAAPGSSACPWKR